MKVAMVIDGWFPLVGGGQVHVWELSRRLVLNHGCEIDIVSRALPDEQDHAPAANESHLDGRLRVWRLGPARRFEVVGARLSFLARAAIWLARRRFDLIHAHTFLPGIPAKIARALRGAPVVYTVHGTSLFTPEPAGLRPRLERALERWLVTRARYDHLITVAENFRQLPNRNAAISVIPNGVDLERFAQSRPWPEQFRLLFVGRFDPIKGAHVLIEAMALLARRGRKFPLTLVGFGPQEPTLRELVAQHGLGDVVTFAGKVTGEALVTTYGAHSLLVLPSLSEGLPLTPLEAWAARRPVLATAVGDNPLYVREGQTGFMAAPGDAGALADAIERAANCAELQQMGERGRQLVRKKFNWDRMTAEVFAVYRGVLEK